MSRYIDADKLKRKVQRIATEAWKMKLTASVETTLNQFIDYIDSAPSIDIVRCKECKHWERLNYEAPKEGWCDDSIPYSDGRWVDADDFCSYGEREGE